MRARWTLLTELTTLRQPVWDADTLSGSGGDERGGDSECCGDRDSYGGGRGGGGGNSGGGGGAQVHYEQTVGGSNSYSGAGSGIDGGRRDDDIGGRDGGGGGGIDSDSSDADDGVSGGRWAGSIAGGTSSASCPGASGVLSLKDIAMTAVLSPGYMESPSPEAASHSYLQTPVTERRRDHGASTSPSSILGKASSRRAHAASTSASSFNGGAGSPSSFHGRAVPLDPTQPTLKAPGAKHLSLTYDESLSNFAFNFDMRRCITGELALARRLAALCGRWHCTEGTRVLLMLPVRSPACWTSAMAPLTMVTAAAALRAVAATAAAAATVAAAAQPRQARS